MRAPTLGAVLGRRIRTLRASRRWSQADLSDALGVLGLKWGRSQIADIEAGNRDDVTVGQLLLLAEVFNASLPELVEGAGIVRIGAKTERPVELISRMLHGEAPLDPGLEGPQEQPAYGPGLYWVKPGVRSAMVFTELEVRAALQLAVFAEDVNAVALELWGRTIDQELARRTKGSTWYEHTDMEGKLIDELGSRSELVKRVRARRAEP